MRIGDVAYLLAFLCLSPLLITQGIYVRKVTPRLPEPPGKRKGTGGAGPILRFLILGDSAAAGVGALTQEEALSGRLEEELAPDFHVFWRLMAQKGFQACDVAALLEMADREIFDFVVVSVGVNDVTHGTRLGKWKADLKKILDLVEDKFGSPHVIFSAIPPMHLFPALPQPLRWFIGQRALKLNREMEKTIKSRYDCEKADIRFPLEEKYMASDGFHPGVAAYTLWAAQLAGIIRRRAAEKLSSKSETGRSGSFTDRNSQPNFLSGQ